MLYICNKCGLVTDSFNLDGISPEEKDEVIKAAHMGMECNPELYSMGPFTKYECPICNDAMFIYDENRNLACFCGHKAPAGSIQPRIGPPMRALDFWMQQKTMKREDG